MKKIRVALALVTMASAALALVAVALAAGNWSAARSKAEAVKREHRDLKKMTPSETRKIVKAICDADDEDRRAVAADAGRRAKDKVTREYTALETLKDDALQLLDDVIADSSLSKHHGEAQAYVADIAKRWRSITRMTKSVRGANHPVIKFMLDEGNQAHKDYQSDPENCDAYEVTVGKGRADCVTIEGSVCTVIELKPDNTRAVNNGGLQARRYMTELRKRGDAFKNLVKKNSAFAGCKSFTSRVHCYTLCPKIDDDDGTYVSTTPTWREDCR